MGRFCYFADPLFLLSCAAYAANRWGLKPHIHTSFFHGYFNDVFLIPCALPLVLWLHRRLGLRSHDDFPRVTEIFFHLVVWSLLFEWIGPKLMRHVTGDPLDVVAYAVGAVGAALIWRSCRSRPELQRV